MSDRIIPSEGSGMKIPFSDPELIQISAGGFDDNFAYVIHDPVSRETAVVDPCGDGRKIREILQQIPDIKPAYILVTHAHGDHISALQTVRQFFPAPLVALQPDLKAEIIPDHGQKLSFGAGEIQVLHTPGHSDDSVCFYWPQQTGLFSGDTLFIDDIGFCNGVQMFETLRQIILPLPGNTMVYPGHDYGRLPADTLENIRRNNPFLAASSRSLDAFLAQLQHLV